MTERSRLDLLRQAGLTAWQGLKAVAMGVDVVVEPEPEVDAPEATGVGTEIGRRAMAAAEHRVGAAAVGSAGSAGSAVTSGELLATVSLTLAVYPGAAVPLLVSALGLTAEPLPVDGDLEVAATSRDLAWLPLAMGRLYYARFPGGRLLATGGYRRAALVRLEAGAGASPGTWCALGDDGLTAGLERPPELIQERPEQLWQAMAQGRVRQALLGGELLARALALPGAAVAVSLAMLPLWGLFSIGRTPVFSGVADEQLVVMNETKVLCGADLRLIV